MGQAKYEFYLNDSKVYFILAQTYNYNAPATSSQYDEAKTKLKEDRYYFWDNKMIRWINPDGQGVDRTSEQFKKEQNEMLEWANSAIQKFD